jgi:hypothetical protein
LDVTRDAARAADRPGPARKCPEVKDEKTAAIAAAGPDQMIRANTKPTATMATMVAIRALGSVSIMRCWNAPPGRTSEMAPRDGLEPPTQ